MLEKGTSAPEFKLDDQDGNPVSLADFKGKKILLWFYPKASTPGCTIEGQEFRDEFQKFQEKNTVILGMSADSVKSQKNFCEKQNFPFSLVSDPEKTTIRKYEAIGLKKMYGREYEGIFRISYLIDENGFIQKTYGKVKPKEHAKEVLEDLD
tara:strand:- start:430 stop:885 length:456 start_codon:yes stop_codon:yes gene_type:complete